jgi:signal transduction histidine kinase
MKLYKRPEFYFVFHTAINFVLFFLIYISLFNKILDKWTIFNFSIILIFLAIIINIIFLSTKNKSVKYYEKLVSKMEDSDDGSELSQFLKFKFPEEDELGRLGSVLNKLIYNLNEFDKLKKEKIQLYKKQILFLINLFEKPLVTTDNEGNIIYKNKAFENFVKIDNEANSISLLQIFEFSKELNSTLKDAFKNKSEDFFQQFSKIEINGKLYGSMQISGFKQKTEKYEGYIILFSF